jgi:2-polyprenyl-6-methoxyphenol hydroxylase-like FAD-dependent oxidoreductase
MELGARGQRVLLIDEGDGRVVHAKAGGFSIRTMEICRRWGVSEAVRNCGFPDDYPLDIVFCTGMQGYELIRESYPSLGAMPIPNESPERRQRCPQMWFDPILAKAASALPSVHIIYQTRVEELEIGPNGEVIGRCRSLDSDEAFSVSARYAAACDGASSGIRENLGISMSGKPLLNYSISVFFRAPNLLKETNQDPAARWIFVSPSGTVGNLTVVDGRELWRFTYISGRERHDLGALDVPGKLRSVLGDGVEFEVISVLPWRRSELVADSYRAGPIFLVGDSVHSMSPTGGFGANTGIGDAVDIGWKLDAVLRGWGGERLLDSYEVERRPIAIRNAAAATTNYRGWHSTGDTSGLLGPGEEGHRVRRAVGAELLEATRAEWESMGVILGYRYENSPICVPDGSPEPPDDYHTYVPTNRAGHRAPHVWLGENKSTLDLFGDGFVLLDLSDTDRYSQSLIGAATAAGVPLRRYALPPGLESLYSTRLTLVRPDGHVAWRGDQLDLDPSEFLGVVTGN